MEMTNFETMKSEVTDKFIALLEKEDAEVVDAKKQYDECIELLKCKVGNRLPFIHEFDKAMRDMLGVELVYSFSLGIKANRAIFEDPIANDFLKSDFEVYLRESTAHKLPDYLEKAHQIDAFYSQLSEEELDTTKPIDEYKSFLQTYGPKMAHYYGFLYANMVLPLVEPGYHVNRSFTNNYRIMLKDYLQIDLPTIYPESETDNA